MGRGKEKNEERQQRSSRNGSFFFVCKIVRGFMESCFISTSVFFLKTSRKTAGEMVTKSGEIAGKKRMRAIEQKCEEQKLEECEQP